MQNTEHMEQNYPAIWTRCTSGVNHVRVCNKKTCWKVALGNFLPNLFTDWFHLFEGEE
jgi:hypothetical protein